MPSPLLYGAVLAALLVNVGSAKAFSDFTNCQFDSSPSARFEACSREIEKNPTNSHAYDIRGELYYDMGKFEEAISDWAKAGPSCISFNIRKRSVAYHSTKRNELIPYIETAELCIQQRNHLLAVKHYTDAMKLAPKDPKLYLMRGKAYEAFSKLVIGCSFSRRGPTL